MIDLTAAPRSPTSSAASWPTSRPPTPPRPGSPAPSSSTRAQSTPGGLFLALPGARVRRARLRRGGRGRPVRSRCWPPDRSGCRRSSCDPTPEPSDPGASVLEHDADGSGAAVLAGAGPARRGGRGRTGGRRADDRRDHRLVGQDVDQGPDRRGARARSARWSPRRARSTTSSATRGRCCARRRHRLPGAGDVGAPPRQHRRAGRDRAAVDRRRAQRRHRAPRRVRLAARRSPRRRPNCRRRFRRPGWSSSTPTTPRWPRWRTRPRRGWCGSRGRPGADVWAEDVTLDELARPRLHAARRRTPTSTVTLAVHGDHQVSNALCAAAVALECGATGEQVAAALAARGPGVAAPDAGHAPATTASRSSTTPTTPTPTRCAPG